MAVLDDAKAVCPDLPDSKPYSWYTTLECLALLLGNPIWVMEASAWLPYDSLLCPSSGPSQHITCRLWFDGNIGRSIESVSRYVATWSSSPASLLLWDSGLYIIGISEWTGCLSS